MSALRGSGRSTNLALGYTRQALDQAGTPVEVIDHWQDQRAHEDLARRVSAVLFALNVPATRIGNSIRVEVRK